MNLLNVTEDFSLCTRRLSALPRSALIAFAPVLFGTDAAV